MFLNGLRYLLREEDVKSRLVLTALLGQVLLCHRIHLVQIVGLRNQGTSICNRALIGIVIIGLLRPLCHGLQVPDRGAGQIHSETYGPEIQHLAHVRRQGPLTCAQQLHLRPVLGNCVVIGNDRLS